MFASVLIANRGEIACRIIRTARAMGLHTIAVYSEADRGAMHAEMANEALALSGARPEESYLDIAGVLDAARTGAADCLHPGYGFLAENADFAEACARAGVAFVGPPPAAIRAMGRKDEARRLMAKAGVPVLPGRDAEPDDGPGLEAAARAIGYPVMIKAVAGGGGTGMRRADAPEDLAEAAEAARREAQAAFGDARLILEKCLDRPRHIEVQILADAYGHCVHLFERDCSLQRRRQKIIEEAPAPGMPSGLRARMGEAALAAARAVGYKGAGTVEFLVEDKEVSDSADFFFLEMNTRLQVEHPVTEEITGLDLVEWQFRVAAGEPLGFTQEVIACRGHAVEARICAEDPARGFLPSAGKLYRVRWPAGEGVRVEAGVRTGDTVSPYYDSLLAKVVAHGADRSEALSRLRAALGDTVIAGPRTNLAFLHDLLGREAVAAGMPDTGLVEREGAPAEASFDAGAMKAGIRALFAARRRRAMACRARLSGEPASPWDADDGFALTPPVPVPYDFLVDGAPVRARVTGGGPGMEVSLPDHPDAAEETGRAFETVEAGDRVFVLDGGRQIEVAFAHGGLGDVPGGAESGVVRAPMHGRIVTLHAAPGETVTKGQVLAVLEAMKMEHRLQAPRDGVIGEIAVSEGGQVGEGAVIVTIAEEGAP